MSSSRLSRRKLAIYVAGRLLQDDPTIIDELAALLVSERRVREADLIVRDIEEQLSVAGQMILTVETAREIDGTTRRSIEQLFADKTVHIRQIIRPELIGGLKISTPSQFIDASLAKKITDLRMMKV